MNPHPLPAQQPSLRIWQQNLNKSLTSQLELLHSMHPTSFAIAAIQEPYLDHNQCSRGTSKWNIVYPSPYYTNEMHEHKTRSLLLINSRINTDCWTRIPVPSWDITAVSFRTPAVSLLIINTYNDCTHSDAIANIHHLLSSRPCPAHAPPQTPPPKQSYS
jgi:hypothetical protein